MPYMDPQWSEPSWALASDLLRYLSWVCIGGLIAMGACWCGGVMAMHAYRDWQRSGPPRRRRHSRDSVECEAARGIREIEVFLGAPTTTRRSDPENWS